MKNPFSLIERYSQLAGIAPVTAQTSLLLLVYFLSIIPLGFSAFYGLAFFGFVLAVNGATLMVFGERWWHRPALNH